MAGEELSLQLRRLWRLPEPASKQGRPSSLDTDSVVLAAISLADRGGLEAATLPKVAVELGVTAMSLYRHVGSKQELLELMVDRASTPPTPREGADSWREALQDWADQLWDLYYERSWIVRVPVHGAPSGPNQLVWFERALAIFDDTDLTWPEKVGFCMVTSGHVRQSILLTQDLAAGRADAEEQAESERRYGLVMRELVEPDRFPALTSMFASTVFDGPDESTMTTARRDFHTGMTVILDGIAARLEGRAGLADPTR
ncbi:putative transcriptional regulator, TetR family [Nocardia nova SH22a]|uniref:Putative transcriptional regulator, TetR family n=1 Tax=Nocardia nova SH22a TaxID=1415166 RepID=W5T9C2_9NOCA|nr:TetR/AcrR family transcriptional regulator [Nocardia nova]AHH15593.1 putative transcriptional regulator, TetR family [Nocardia nova SH22a]